MSRKLKASNEQDKKIEAVSEVHYDEITNVLSVMQVSGQTSGSIDFDQVFKYIKFQCPVISSNVSYKLKIQLSQNKDFGNYGHQNIIIDTNPTSASGLIDSTSGIYYIFNNNQWHQYDNLILQNTESLKVVKIDISNQLQKDSNFFPYYGRMQFINQKTSELGNYIGFSLSLIDIQTDTYQNVTSKYSSIKLSGSPYISANTQMPFYLIGQLRDQVDVYEDLTDEATFDCYPSGNSISGCYFNDDNILHIGNYLDDDTVLISANAIIENQLKTFYFQSYIKANKLINYYIECDNAIDPGIKQQIKITAKYSNGTKLDVTGNSEINIIPSGYGTILTVDTASSTIYALSANTQIPNDQIGLINAKYPISNPINFAQKQIKFNKSPKYYLDQEFLSGQSSVINNKYYGVIANLTKDNKDVKFKIVLKDLNNSKYKLDISEDVKIEEVETDYLTISKENGINIIKINDYTFFNLKNDIKVVIDISYQKLNLNKKQQIVITAIPIQKKDPREFTDIQFEFIGGNVIKKNQTLQYVVYGIKELSGNQFQKVDITQRCKFDLITPNNEAVLLPNKRLISGGNFDYASFGTLKMIYPQTETERIFTKYLEILFKADPIKIKYEDRLNAPGWIRPDLQEFTDQTVILYSPLLGLTTNYGNVLSSRFTRLANDFTLDSVQYIPSSIVTDGKMYLIDTKLSAFLGNQLFDTTEESGKVIIFNAINSQNHYEVFNFTFSVSGTVTSGNQYDPYIYNISGDVTDDVRQHRNLWKFESLSIQNERLYKICEGIQSAKSNSQWAGYSINENNQPGVWRNGVFIKGQKDYFNCGQLTYKTDTSLQTYKNTTYKYKIGTSIVDIKLSQFDYGWYNLNETYNNVKCYSSKDNLFHIKYKMYSDQKYYWMITYQSNNLQLDLFKANKPSGKISQLQFISINNDKLIKIKLILSNVM